jgi:hypothetical protein
MSETGLRVRIVNTDINIFIKEYLDSFIAGSLQKNLFFMMLKFLDLFTILFLYEAENRSERNYGTKYFLPMVFLNMLCYTKKSGFLAITGGLRQLSK